MWARIATITCGIWLMAAPAILGYDGLAAVNHRVIGPLVASFAAIAIWEVTRPLRWLGVPLGLWLMVAPLLLGYGDTGRLNGLAVGVIVVGLSLIRRKVAQRFGGGWSSLWRTSGFPPEKAPSDTKLA